MSVPIASGRLERGQRRGRAAAGAARDPGEVPRVAGRAVRRVLGGGAHGELVHVRLAQDHDPGGPQPRGDRGVVGRAPALEDLRARGGRHVVVVTTSLSASGTPGQRRRGRGAGGERARRPARPTAARPRRRRAGTRARCPSTAAIRSRCACATSTAETSREWIFSASSAAVSRVRSRSCSSPRICGTRKRPSSAAGAPASACSWVRPGATLVGAEHVLQRHGVRGRRDVVGRPTSPTRATAPRMTSSWPAKRSSSASVTASRASRARCATSSRVIAPVSAATMSSTDDCGTSRRGTGRGRRPEPRV